MKKVIFFLIVIILAGAAITYVGWVRIPQNNYAIFFSSITGYEKQVLENGAFHWRWQKLIPKNYEVYFIPSAPRKLELRLQGELPSGKIFSAALPGNPDFSYSAAVNVSYEFNKDFLLDYVIKNGSGTIDYIEADKRVERIIVSKIDNLFLESDSSLKTNADIDKQLFSVETLGQFITDNFKEVALVDVSVLSLSFPDVALYKTAYAQYREILAVKNKYFSEAEIKAAILNNNLEKGMEALQKYGELLTKNPLLIEYFKLNPNADILAEILKESKKN